MNHQLLNRAEGDANNARCVAAAFIVVVCHHNTRGNCGNDDECLRNNRNYCIDNNDDAINHGYD